MKRLSESGQNRISIAGVSANLVTSMIFFLVTFAIIAYVLPGISTDGVLITQVAPGYPANGVIPVNSTILAWNNVQIANSYDLSVAEASYTPGPGSVY